MSNKLEKVGFALGSIIVGAIALGIVAVIVALFVKLIGWIL